MQKLFPSWVFDAALGQYIAPVARPTDGKLYAWRESTLSWILMPEMPTEGQHLFNVETGNWEKV